MNRTDGPWRNDTQHAWSREAPRRDGRDQPPLYGGQGYPQHQDPSFRDDPRYRWAYPEASRGHEEGFFENAGYKLAELGHRIEGAVTGLVGRRTPKGYK